MEMITKDFDSRRYLFAVAIFFSVSATTCQAADTKTNPAAVTSDSFSEVNDAEDSTSPVEEGASETNELVNDTENSTAPVEEDATATNELVDDTENSTAPVEEDATETNNLADETQEITTIVEEDSTTSNALANLPYKNYTTFTICGKTIYTNGGNFTNSDNFTSGEIGGVGLHVCGGRNSVNQRGNISLSGLGAIGVRVDGFDNQITVSPGTNIESSSTGILIAYGRNNNLNVAGQILASGNAVEFNFGSNSLGVTGEYRGSYIRYLRGVDTEGNIISAVNLPLEMASGEYNFTANELSGALVDNFNLSGKIAGSRAIYIGQNTFVKNINVNRGAQISGNIVSDWKHFSANNGGTLEPIKIQYGGQTIDATRYIPDLVTNLNFNTDLAYGGRISGSDNIKMHVKSGTLKFSGTADVVSVDVMGGARLYGGTFIVNNQNANAEGFSDATTGKFINHGTIAAGSPNTNLVINGDLISDGVLQKVSGGEAGSIIVNGNANIEGSTVTTDSLLPNETATVLVANSISGNIKNPEGKPVPISAMLTATGKVVNNTLLVTTHQASDNPIEQNFSDGDGKGAPPPDSFDAMNNMFEHLEGTPRQEEMRKLYNLGDKEAGRALRQIGANDSAQVMSVAQQSAAVDKMVSGRIAKVLAPDFFTPDFITLNVAPMAFADGDNDSPEMKVKVKVPKRHENNFWINYMKNWGSLRGGTDYHGSAIVAGYDRPFGKKVRAGIFATYGTIGYGAKSSRATVYDTRLGLYAGYHNKQSDVYFYINGGQLRNSLHRGISSLGLTTKANYKSHIVEIGGEYKYDLQPKRIWHVSPFVNFQASYLKQNSYNERGAGIYNQHVESGSNTYFAAQTGIDLKRYYRTGMIGMRFGIKRGFTGADPDLRMSYEGDGSNSYRIRYERDKTHFICSLRGESEFARNWFLGGEAEFQFGENDKDVTASIMFRRIW